MITWLSVNAMQAMLPATRALPGVDDTEIKGFTRQFLTEASPMLKLGFYLGVLCFHLSPIVTIFVPLPAFLLPAGLRDKHAYKAATSRIYLLRQNVFLVKLVGGLCWGADMGVRQKLGQIALPLDPGTWQPDFQLDEADDNTQQPTAADAADAGDAA